jgi:actin, other eukaryote
MEAELDSKIFIVIDNGTGYIKAGYSGDDAPTVILPSVVSVVESQEQGKPKTFYSGPDLDLKNPETALQFPLERGTIKNTPQDWESIEFIWEHIIKNLMQQELSSANVLITDSILNTRENREHIAQIFFEHLGVNSLGIMASPVLSLFSIGKTRGVVLDVGCGLTSIVPVFEGYALPHAIHKIPLSGTDITNFIHKKLLNHLKPSQTFIARNIKEEMMIVPLSYQKNAALLSEEKRHYELPGGKIIKVDQDILCDAAEILFRPSIVDLNIPSIPDQVVESILKCDVDLRPDMYENIVLSGGSSMAKGFYERIEKDIKARLELHAPSNDIKIHADSFRQHAAWIGGSMLASLSTFGQFMVIKKEEWENDTYKKPLLIHKYSF